MDNNQTKATQICLTIYIIYCKNYFKKLKY